MHFSTILLLSAAAAVSAHPSGNSGHVHRRLHGAAAKEEKRAVGDIVTATIDGKVVTWVNTYDGGSPFQIAAPPAATTTTTTTTPPPSPSPTAAAAANVAAVNAGSSGQGLTSFVELCFSNTKRATEAEINYVGVTGGPDNWGCNIQKVATDAVATQYNNRIKFISGSTALSCIAWNKIGKDGLLTGQYSPTGATSFNLAANSQQWLVFSDNSQGAVSCCPGSGLGAILRDTWGAIGCTWTEFDFKNAGNDDWSGGDASCIIAQNAKQAVPGLKLTFSGTNQYSIIHPGGLAEHAFNATFASSDGLGINTDATVVEYIADYSFGQ